MSSIPDSIFTIQSTFHSNVSRRLHDYIAISDLQNYFFNLMEIDMGNFKMHQSTEYLGNYYIKQSGKIKIQ